MNKKIVLSLSLVGVALLISSCKYTKDPYEKYKSAGLSAFNKYYENNPGYEKKGLFYFDISTLKGTLVKWDEKLNSPKIIYLGQLNISNFSFSENPNRYYVDLGNLPMRVVDSEGDGYLDDVEIGNYLTKDSSGNYSFSIQKLLKEPPFILNEYDEAKEELVNSYSMVLSDGTIPDTSNVIGYDPNFFYISDFSINLEGAKDYTGDMLNFTGYDLSFARSDFYLIIKKVLEQDKFDGVNTCFNFSNLLFNNYKKTVGIKDETGTQRMPSDLYINGYHQTNEKTKPNKVVIGPLGYFVNLISVASSGQFKESDFEPAINSVETLRIGEGISTVGFCAFGAKRDENGVSKSKIKNIYLPSSLQHIQFNSFSNLDLENLYIPKTYVEATTKTEEKAFDTIDFGSPTFKFGRDDNKIEINVMPSFGNTTIKNIYFQDYSNKNIEGFPFETTSLKTSKDIESAFKVYSDINDVNKTFETLDEGFKHYDTINPFYQIALKEDEKKKFVIQSSISNIAKGKKLYLPYKKVSMMVSEARALNTFNGVKGNDISNNDATITLKLDRDLIIEGEVILGAQIGFTNSGTGAINGEFSAIDLNGHKITVKKGGKLIGNGLIYDSTNKNLGITVENGGTLFTNFTVNDYTNFDDLDKKAENGVSLFNSYSFSSLKVQTTIQSGGKLSSIIEYFGKGFVNENNIDFIGNDKNSLIQISEGEVVLNNKTLKITSKNAKINNVTLFAIKDDSSYTQDVTNYDLKTNPFEVFNDSLSLVADSITATNGIKLTFESGNSAINSLYLEDNSSIYVKDPNSLKIQNKIEKVGDAKNITLIGKYYLNEIAYLNVKEQINKFDSSYNFKGTVKELNAGVLSTMLVSFNSFVGQENKFDKHLYKFENGYYYEYLNDAKSGSLNTNDNKVLAHYDSSNQYWKAENGSEITTDVLQDNKTISSFNVYDGEVISSTVVLSKDLNNKYSWNEVSTINADGTYKSGEKLFIRVDGSGLMEGNFIDLSTTKAIFKVAKTGENYVYSSKKWINVSLFDYGYTLKSKVGNLYFAYFNNTYNLVEKYDEDKHVAEDLTKKYIFTTDGTTFKYVTEDKLLDVDWENKQIVKEVTSSKKSGYIYLGNQKAWAYATYLYKGTCINNSCYYFLINGIWQQSVNGNTYSLNYNKTANYSFGVLKEKYSYNGNKYKFVYKEGDGTISSDKIGAEVDKPFELMMPQARVDIKKDDFPDLWEKLNTPTDHLSAYRHIEDVNGNKFLFYKGKDGKIVKKQFEYAPSFTPSYPTSGGSILTKFNFIIYRVCFYENGKLGNPQTVYISVDDANKDNAIYAGNVDNPNNEDYLGLAVFGDTNPIDVLMKTL